MKEVMRPVVGLPSVPCLARPKWINTSTIEKICRRSWTAWERRFNSPPMCRSETPLLPAGNKWHVSLHYIAAIELTEVNFPSGGHFSPARGEVSPPQRGATFTAVPSCPRRMPAPHNGTCCTGARGDPTSAKDSTHLQYFGQKIQFIAFRH